MAAGEQWESLYAAGSVDSVHDDSGAWHDERIQGAGADVHPGDFAVGRDFLHRRNVRPMARQLAGGWFVIDGVDPPGHRRREGGDRGTAGYEAANPGCHPREGRIDLGDRGCEGGGVVEVDAWPPIIEVRLGKRLFLFAEIQGRPELAWIQREALENVTTINTGRITQNLRRACV